MKLPSLIVAVLSVHLLAAQDKPKEITTPLPYTELYAWAVRIGETPT